MTEDKGLSRALIQRFRDIAEGKKEDPYGDRRILLLISEEEMIFWNSYLESNGFAQDLERLKHEKKLFGWDVAVMHIKEQTYNHMDARKITKKFYEDINKKYQRGKR